ncbi:MAG: hypothetical protein ACLQPD_33010 [Desulfomonilaceae bacterium]
MNDTGRPQEVNPKPHHEPKSVEWWRAKLDETEDDAYGHFKLLPRLMLNSRAFAELTYGGVQFVLAMLDKLHYKDNHKTTGGRGVKSSKKLAPAVVKDGGRFKVTNNELIARGVKSSATISAARSQAWELGFYDVEKTGTLKNPAEGKYSERWKLFPDGPFQPNGQPRPGKCLYPNRDLGKLKPTLKTDVKPLTLKNDVKGRSGQKSRSNEVKDLEGPRSHQKLKLFTNLHRGGGTKLQETAGALGSTDANHKPLQPTDRKKNPMQIGGPEVSAGDTWEHGGGPSLHTPELPREQTDIERVVEIMESHGLSVTCTEIGGEDTILTFSDGSTVGVGRYITYTDPDGKNLEDCILPETFAQKLAQKLPANSVRSSVQLADTVKRVDGIMFSYGYGHCTQDGEAHGEVHMKFGGDVHAWVMVDSIMVERPGRKRLRVKTPEKLQQRLKSERGVTQ